MKDARKRGQVPRSRDLVASFSLLASTLLLARMGGFAMARVASRLMMGLSRVGDHARTTLTPADIGTLITGDVIFVGLTVGPLLVMAAVIAVAGNVAQSGWVFSAEALQLNWGRLSPKNGLQRLKPSQSGLDLLKTVFAVSAVAALAYSVARDVIDDGPRLVALTPGDAARAAWEQMLRLLWRCGFALLALAAGDYGLQVWRNLSSLKMSKQELKDEGKQSEGSPLVKGRIRKLQREMLKRRMLSAVKDATVVVTNPTHYAVALRYQRGAMAAPVIVAKGKDLLAARIKKIAREHSVPVVENVSLAQALFKGAEVGDAIPAPLFGAVAEVLAYLVRIKQLML